MNLEGKTILVTGSSSGIGRGTALQLARERCRLILTYFKGEAAGKAVLKECLKHGDAALYRLDVRNEESIRLLVKSITDRFSSLDVLINVAGVMAENPLIKQSAEDTANQVGVNLLGLINVTRSFLPLLQMQKEAVIVNIASGLAKEVLPKLTVYCATKWGVRGFTRAIALELPGKVRVYCVNPGLTATRMTDYQGADPADVAKIIVWTAAEKLRKKSGDDVDVWRYVSQE
ncbi:MAG: SDR family oxidoreductase [Syntrophales bacterium]|jgi:NAD(P)-dependent dehydrogenase (short-subunit alcohol dehydrogenase family)